MLLICIFILYNEVKFPILRSIFIFCLVGNLSILIKTDTHKATVIHSRFAKGETRKKQIIVSLQPKSTTLADSQSHSHRVKKDNINSQQLTFIQHLLCS